MSCPSHCQQICSTCEYMYPGSMLFGIDCGLTPEYCTAVCYGADAPVVDDPFELLYCVWVDKFICPYAVDDGALPSYCASCRVHLPYKGVSFYGSEK